MKKTLILLALVTSAAACASEKKQANSSSENTENTKNASVVATTNITTENSVSSHNTSTPQEEEKIILPRQNEDGSEMTFEQVLNKYKGKVIYVDFWASWCPPCRAEMPSSQELHTYFEGKDVVFLYVSFDRKEEAWKNGIEKMNIKGVHYYPMGGASQAVATKYQVSGIPRYMLVNKEGKVVNADAPRPSSGTVIKTMINELL